MKNTLIVLLLLTALSCQDDLYKWQPPIKTIPGCDTCDTDTIIIETQIVCCRIYNEQGTEVGACVTSNGDCKPCYVWCAENQ